MISSVFSGRVLSSVAEGEWGLEESPAVMRLDDGQEFPLFELFAPRGFHPDPESRFRSVYGLYRLKTTPLDERAEEWGGEELEAFLVKECWDGRWREGLVSPERPGLKLLTRLFGSGLDAGERDYGRFKLEVMPLPYQAPSTWLPLSEEEGRLEELQALEQGESKRSSDESPAISAAEMEERRRLAELILSGELPLEAVKSPL